MLVDPETVQTPVFITQTVVDTVPTLTLFAPCDDPTTDTSTTTTTSTDVPPSTPPALPSFPPSTSLPPPPSPSPTPAPTFAPSTTDYGNYTPVSTITTDGSIIIIYNTIAGSSTSTTTSSSTYTPAPQSEPASGSSDLAPILGGTLGGFFLLTGIVGIIWFLVYACPLQVLFLGADFSVSATGTRGGSSCGQTRTRYTRGTASGDPKNHPPSADRISMA